MNSRQAWVVRVTITILALMLAFPPFQLVDNGVVFNLGYSLVYKPPEHCNYRGGYAKCADGSVNIPLLMVQQLGVLAIAGLLFLLLRKPKRPKPATEDKPVPEVELPRLFD